MPATVTLQHLAAVWSIDASVLQTRYQRIAILGYSPSPYSKQLKTNFEHRKIHWTLELEAGTGADSVFQPSAVLRFAAPQLQRYDLACAPGSTKIQPTGD